LKTIYLQANSSLKESNLALALGFFDGVHLAHMELLKKTVDIGKQRHIQTGMMTFSTHILSFIYQTEFHYLTSVQDKMVVAEKLGFDYLYVIEVSDELINLAPEEFITQFLSTQKVVVVGFDYTFGKYGKGNVDLLLKQKRFETIVIQEMVHESLKIGSSRIRALIQDGNIGLANTLLGNPYRVKGKVVRGKNRGKNLGFPTANIENPGYLLPKPGVYIVLVYVNDLGYPALANVGDNPTFNDNHVTLEAFILDFSQDLYGQFLEVEFLAYLREEIKFDHIDLLVETMHQDELKTRIWFEKRENI